MASTSANSIKIFYEGNTSFVLTQKGIKFLRNTQVSSSFDNGILTLKDEDIESLFERKTSTVGGMTVSSAIFEPGAIIRGTGTITVNGKAYTADSLSGGPRGSRSPFEKEWVEFGYAEEPILEELRVDGKATVTFEQFTVSELGFVIEVKNGAHVKLGGAHVPGDGDLEMLDMTIENATVDAGRSYVNTLILKTKGVDAYLLGVIALQDSTILMEGGEASIRFDEKCIKNHTILDNAYLNEMKYKGV